MLLEDLVAGIWLRNRTGPWKRSDPSLFQCLPDTGLGTGTDERECRKQDLPKVGPSLGATWSHWGRLDKSIYSLSLSGPIRAWVHLPGKWERADKSKPRGQSHCYKQT